MKSLKSLFGVWMRGAVAEASDCKGLVPVPNAGARHPSKAGAAASSADGKYGPLYIVCFL